MRVALVIQKLAGLRGGAERVAIDLAAGLADRGHAVTLITFEPSSDPPGYDTGSIAVESIFPTTLATLLPRHAGAGSRIEVAESIVSVRGNQRWLARAKWHATHGFFARRLQRWLRRHPHDAVIGFMPPAISAVALAGRGLGDHRPRLIASTHNVPTIDFGDGGRWDPNPVARRINLQALEMVDTVTVLLPEFVEQLPPAVRPHAVAVPNGVRRLGTPTGTARRDVIVGVGRLTSIKRYHVLIEAFGRLAPEFPEWELVLCGDGPERSRLEAMAARPEMDGRVSLVGAVDDIAARYDTARVLGHPAAFEGFGLAVAEAILHGLIVVASRDCPGVNQLIEPPSTGLLVAEEALTDSFTDALRWAMATPPPEAERADAAQRLAKHLDPARIIDTWEAILHGDLP